MYYLSQTLARDRSSELYEQAQRSRVARQAAELRKVERARHRAERKLLRVWQRADELRTSIGAAG